MIVPTWAWIVSGAAAIVFVGFSIADFFVSKKRQKKSGGDDK